MQFTWKIGGEAGFGIMTTGLLFSKIAARRGYDIFDFVEYPSLIRGGHNTYEVVVSDAPVSSLKKNIDVLVCLNKETFDVNKQRLDPQAKIIYDPEVFTPDGDVVFIPIPFTSILKELQGQVIMKNTIALGASLALLGADLTELHTIFVSQFGRKGDAVVSLNQQFAQKGFDAVVASSKDAITPHLITRDGGKKMVLTGNEAFAYGAVAADCRYYSAYPMTPSSGVLAAVAAWSKKTGMVVRHAEDEIAVINSALGASFAGARVAVGTSGGGFALMVEAVSMSGITEVPIVVFISQRPGPATGMPTWTEQAELLFAIHGGHGEFPKIVLAPGDHQEMVEMTLEAFDLADIYQLPVIVLSDMLLSESHKSIPYDEVQNKLKTYVPNRGKLITEADISYKRYLITEDGISPRLVPGETKTYYQSNSYEHLEDGHTTESDIERIKQVHKRAAKIQTYLSSHFKVPQIIGDIEKSSTVFVGWGSTKGVGMEAVRKAKEMGKEIAYIHFSYLYPLDKAKIKSMISDSSKKYVLVENNSEGQLGKLLQMEIGVSLEQKILRYDGRPLTVEQLLELVA
jgi:2-oxoglutarate ferredoxin oxidoreductase subunit alpha